MLLACSSSIFDNHLMVITAPAALVVAGEQDGQLHQEPLLLNATKATEACVEGV